MKYCITILLIEKDTVSTASLINPDAECKEQYLYEKRRSEQHEMEEIKGVTDKVLKVHGITPGKKGEGATTVIYENRNGFNSQINSNETYHWILDRKIQ